MWGAIAGDIIGSTREFHPREDGTQALFNANSHYTDDTVLSVATMEAVLQINAGTFRGTQEAFAAAYTRWAKRHPNKSYGTRFRGWVHSANPQPYNSLGNGAMMRGWPIGFVTDRGLESKLSLAEISAEVTHNHPDAVATLRGVITAIHNKELHSQRLHPWDKFQKISQYSEHSWPTFHQVVHCISHSNSYEETMHRVCSINCDTDTVGCIAGAIAESFWGVPDWVVKNARDRVPTEMGMLVDCFESTLCQEPECT